MALQGTLDTFALPDVLRLLATTAKTGRLQIDGDRGEGSVWLRDGTVMAASADRAIDGAPPEEVIFELLRFQEGAFAFHIDDVSPNGEEPHDVEVLLRNAGALLSEWNELESVVPSLDHQVVLVEALPSDEVTIEASRWPSIVAVGSGRSVGELGQALTLGELAVTRIVRDLVDLGVAEIKEPAARSRSSVSAGRSTGRSERRTADDRRAADDRRERRDRSERADTPPPDSRRGPFSSLGSGEMLATSPGRTDPTTGEMQRATWLQPSERSTGQQPAVEPEPRSGLSPSGRGGPAGNGTPSVPPPHTPPAADMTARLGRSGGSRSGTNGRASGRDKRSGPSSRRPGSSDREGGPAGADAGRSGGANGSASSSRIGKSRPPAAPRRSPSTRPPATPPPAPELGDLTAPHVPFDGGPPLGPPPMPGDTGQVRAVGSAGLPPDLHWAADVESTPPPAPPQGPPQQGPPPAPAFGAGQGTPPTTPIDPNKTAPHVAALSPEARAAVQGSLGATGGSTGTGPVEDGEERGRLMNFLSSVKP